MLSLCVFLFLCLCSMLGCFCPAYLILDAFIFSLVNPLVQAQGFLYSIPTVPAFFFSWFSLVFSSQSVMTSSWSFFCFWVAWRVTLQRHKKRHGINILLPRVIQNLTCVLAVRKDLSHATLPKNQAIHF